MTRPEILAWGLWLQQHGAYLFPVDHPGLPRCAGWHRAGQACDGKRGKHPACSWARDSTSDPGALRALVAGQLRNLAVDTRKSGLLVVDEDRHGAFAEYAASIGQVIPATFTVATAKGRHYWFRQPAVQLGNAPGELAVWDIDIRGRGYVLAPGSLHETGVVYTPDDHTAPVAEMPDWLLTALRPPGWTQARFQHARPRRRTGGPVRGRFRGVLAVVLDATPPAPGLKGNRNERLFWASCKAREMVAAGDLDQAAAVAALAEAAEAVGLGRGEAEATIASAMRGA